MTGSGTRHRPLTRTAMLAQEAGPGVTTTYRPSWIRHRDRNEQDREGAVKAADGMGAQKQGLATRKPALRSIHAVSLSALRLRQRSRPPGPRSSGQGAQDRGSGDGSGRDAQPDAAAARIASISSGAGRQAGTGGGARQGTPDCAFSYERMLRILLTGPMRTFAGPCLAAAQLLHTGHLWHGAAWSDSPRSAVRDKAVACHSACDGRS